MKKELTITLRKARRAGACIDGWKIIRQELGNPSLDEPIEISKLLDSQVDNAALWSLALVDRKACVRYLLDCLDHAGVVATYERRYPEDKRVANCIATLRRWVEGKATQEELRVAASAAKAATWSATGSAAKAAATAATWSAASATWAARAAAGVATKAATGSATGSATKAARAATWSAELAWQKEHLREVLNENQT